VTHAIDEMSPLYGLSLADMASENGEIIAVLDGIDEISSQSYQSRWSYIPSEILSHREFLPCVKREVGCFVVDFGRISDTQGVEKETIVESAEVMEELAASEDFQIICAPKRYASCPVAKCEAERNYRRCKTETDIASGMKVSSNMSGFNEI